jgi:hypothetical protein
VGENWRNFLVFSRIFVFFVFLFSHRAKETTEILQPQIAYFDIDFTAEHVETAKNLDTVFESRITPIFAEAATQGRPVRCASLACFDGFDKLTADKLSTGRGHRVFRHCS